MLANLLGVAGVKHIITVDLHASQMQGFFKCPIDNLHAEPLLARWIRQNVPDWKEGVVVSKNAGGTKRVTSLADALKLSFGIITTDKKRGTDLACSTVFNPLDDLQSQNIVGQNQMTSLATNNRGANDAAQFPVKESLGLLRPVCDRPVATLVSEESSISHSTPMEQVRARDDLEQRYNDHLVQEITRGRLIQGRIVDDNYTFSNSSPAHNSVHEDDPMVMSHASSFFAAEGESLGGSDDAGVASDEEEDVLQDPRVEHMITLVGDVKNRPVFIVDDMIDKPQSWIAAAETVVKRGFAKKVYCMATHGVFGGDCLQQLCACECIDAIVVTNSFPIMQAQARSTNKLVVLDLSSLLAEAIRRNHHGESISALFQQMPA